MAILLTFVVPKLILWFTRAGWSAQPYSINFGLFLTSDLHQLHEDWLVERSKFQPLPAPVLIVDANADLKNLADKFADIESTILEKRSL